MKKNKFKTIKSQSKRLSWDKFWFLIAMAYSTRGPCDRLHTACLIVKDKRLVGAGYNCSVAGLGHCDELGHLMIDGHCERTLHAEENAILNTERRHIKDADVYLLGTPCLRCLKLLANAGIKNVFYIGSYHHGIRHDFQCSKIYMERNAGSVFNCRTFNQFQFCNRRICNKLGQRVK